MNVSNKSISQPFLGKPLFASSLFGDNLPQSQLLFNKIKKQAIVKKNRLICEIGEQPERIYILRSGDASTFIPNPFSNEICKVRNIQKNEILALAESISAFRFECGIRADSNCLFDFIERDDFMDFLQCESDVCFRVLALLGTNIQQSYEVFSSTAL